MNKVEVIDENLLFSYGATRHDFLSSEVIFSEGDIPKYYYQIMHGKVKLNHEDEEGREFIQSILNPGQSVCELLLFLDKSYPVNAVTLEDCSVIRLPKVNFFNLLDDHPRISIDVNRFISGRLYQKFIIMQHNSSINPKIRLKGVFDYFKSFSDDQTQYSYEVQLTRKQLAAITGLRVETVIRAIKRMEKEKFLILKNRKIFV
ncbi:Crp/Fnr family transcriptional regulator [Chryseobacterium daeguense]|uniref:Crp/Fnr family transcriptional regulator n=1 Tax=Chryseobacterium daeguense TaxID=412438 RepID=UPI00042665E8|nr:Crp/Fnr family transcriptional regulator [Chryseobacterium daeguense]